MFCIFLSSYFVGLLAPALVNGYSKVCGFNQTIIAKEESTTTFLVNFTYSGSLRLHLLKTESYIRSVADISIYNKDRERIYISDHSWKTRANISVQFYSDNDTYNVRIDLSNVSMEDNGTYILINRYNRDNPECFTLFILRGPSDPPALVPRKKHHFLVSGDILPNITCTSECNPPCSISWGNYSDGSALSLGTVATDDTGEYTCTATRADGQAVEQTISIYVSVRPSHHIVIVPGQIYYNLVAGDIMPDITCTSDCNPPCNISWRKHGKGNTLSLGAVTTESTGEYTCTARRFDDHIVKQSVIIFVTDDDSKRNKPGDANITFSKSTIQVSGDENYEDLKEETRNINNTYSEVNQALSKEDLAQPSADIYENTMNSKKNENVLQE